MPDIITTPGYPEYGRPNYTLRRLAVLAGVIALGVVTFSLGRQIKDTFDGVECPDETHEVAVPAEGGYQAAVEGETSLLNGADIRDVVDATEDLNGTPNSALLAGQVILVYNYCEG